VVAGTRKGNADEVDDGSAIAVATAEDSLRVDRASAGGASADDGAAEAVSAMLIMPGADAEFESCVSLAWGRQKAGEGEGGDTQCLFHHGGSFLLGSVGGTTA